MKHDGLSGGPLTLEPSSATLDSLLLEVLEVLSVDTEGSPRRRFTEHTQCSALSTALRGKLCTKLERGPGQLLQAGEVLYRAGSVAQSVYLVQSGVLKTSVISSSGEELTLRVYKPGEILGELCLCQGVRQEEATALEVSRVVEMPLPSLLRELHRDPEATLELASAICERLGAAYEGLRLSVDPVMHRLAHVLLKLAEDLGEPIGTGRRIGGGLTQEELAKLVGASRELVSRLLNRLRLSGLISYTPRGPITVQAAALQSFLRSISRE
jgi:CRP/FNR family cyclic AMP-dependent transcriptional regulator